MKMLSMHAPWGQLLAYGIKDVGNRSWSTGYRGPVALHCTKGGTSTREAIEILDDLDQTLLPPGLAKTIAARIESDRGKVIGVAELVGCRSSDRHHSRWAMPGGFALELARARLVLPFELRGARNLTAVEAGVSWRLAPQLELPKPASDVVEANAAWGANCGPTAVAGALGLTMDQVREAVSPDGAFKGFMGVADFKSAIPRAGGRIVRSWSRPDKRELYRTDGSPILVLIRFCGPWDGVPRARSRYRHAFVYRHGYHRDLDWWNQRAQGPGWVYDANGTVPTEDGGFVTPWLPLHAWRNRVMPELIPDRGNGETAIDWMAQVERAGT